MSGGRPTAAFYVAVLAVIGGLVYFAALQGGFLGKPAAPEVAEAKPGEPEIDPGMINVGGEATAEASSDEDLVTTVKNYNFVPAERLPEVKGTAAYKPLEDNTVRFALNVWAGWAPIIHANEGFQPNKV